MANHTCTDALKRSTSTATGRADDLSLRLYHLTEIVKLAAFAAESRRVLEGIKNVADCRPEVDKLIGDSLESPLTWMEMSDSTGNVLDYISRELEAVHNGFLNTVYDLANGVDRGTDQIGGAA